MAIYNESKQWLLDASEGKITIDFPLRQLKQGFGIRFNSNPRNEKYILMLKDRLSSFWGDVAKPLR